MRKPKALQTLVVDSPFDAAISLALSRISQMPVTRNEYRRDVEHWLAFCRERRIDPIAPKRGSVEAWYESMKSGAPKTRARRISSLSSVYRAMKREGDVSHNPFSVDNGPKREKTPALKPTPLAELDALRKTLKVCADDKTPLGLRDAAIIRILWSTGMRRVSILSMTFEWLERDHDSFIATVLKKGGDTLRVLIRGKAFHTLNRWLDVMRKGGFSKGPIWRMQNGVPVSTRELNRIIDTRTTAAGVPGSLSPHMLRVAFLTYNPASLEAKQDAAGHADPSTTQLYDRTEWRGREAFEQMPEIEDIQ